jgi:hypothetical protein
MLKYIFHILFLMVSMYCIDFRGSMVLIFVMFALKLGWLPFVQNVIM